MFQILSLIAILSRALSESSLPLTRFPVGRSLCEKFCVNIKGCDVVSYLPEKLMCVIGNRHQEGYILFHINKSNTDLGLCGTNSSFQGQYLVSKSGQGICVRTYPSGVRERGIAYLLVVYVNNCALLVNLETMVTKLYPNKLSRGVIDLAYMPWNNSLVLVLRSLRTNIVPVGIGNVSRFVRVRSFRCAVDSDNEIVFLATRMGLILNVIHGKVHRHLTNLHRRPYGLDVDSRSKGIFVSLENRIIRITYKGKKKTTLITFDKFVYGLSIDETSNMLYGLTIYQILIHDLSQNTTVYVSIIYPRPNISMKTANSKVFIISGSLILSIENDTVKTIGKLPYNTTRRFATCVL